MPMHAIADEIPDKFIAKWQNTTNVMADIFDVPAGLIMRVLPEQIEVLVSSHTAKNPYEAKEKANLHTGLYCETVMASRTILQVPNALLDEHWNHNPDVALNMISYLGVPLMLPNEEVFGTICVLDNKTRSYQTKYIDLLWEIKKSIEADFKIIEQQAKLQASYAEVLQAIESQKRDAVKLEQANTELSIALASLTKMQCELVRAETMAALGSLVAGVSHELNTPLGNSMMAASSLQYQVATLAAELPKGITRGRINEFVATLGEAADILMRSLSRTADMVSSFKQVAVDQTSLNHRSFSLKATIADILMTLTSPISESQVVVESDIPAMITMDSYPGPLCQILSILISNSIMHAFVGRTHGKITVSAELQEDDMVRLIICDDGIGIPKANLARVFDPFFTTAMGHGGSGLGLHIAYNLAHSALRGTIVVESLPDQGARFTLTLPRVAPVTELK
ncbi:GAF domain-containing sensor histidine kinase [Solimicrobium silvestre]|uniref:histidine kinase n=1 Tax=Solimicrobium silvestre TaxID=2099400 RepID=A0A2S9H0S9_9BURK|nr:GAF domain-containing sensor histidine kinase [Solimicrobium silvestre]PRC93595.1 Histidine kinase-, DNA gyrase B-, and HSP90-like ATPase [Solimicrobium silvestre]